MKKQSAYGSARRLQKIKTSQEFLWVTNGQECVVILNASARVICTWLFSDRQAFEQFEEAVEYDELDIFLRRNEEWNPDIDDDYGLVEQPTGVPGAYMPNQMTGQTPSHAPQGAVAQPAVRPGEMDMGEYMSGYGL